MSAYKSVILITFDCVRPDHLECYGYRGTDTKNINEFANNGMIFKNVIAQAPNTWISMGSIFSGTYPNKHGIRNPYSKLSSKITTMAESFQKGGFKTAGFPAHTLVGSVTGFNRGFDYFNEDKADFEFSATTSNNYYFRKWDSMWEKGKKWMLSQNAPFFIWFHYMETHWAPEDFLSLPNEYKKGYSTFGQYYDGKISHADASCVNDIRTFLKEKNLYQNALVVLHSDHGEDLVKNDPPYLYGGHNRNLFDNVMKIPLIIFNGESDFKGEIVKNMVRSIDIMPIILELSKLSIPEGIDGESFSDIINSQNNDKPRYAYMENLTKGFIGIRSESWKLILTINRKKRPQVSGIRSVLIVMHEKLREQKKNINPIIYFKFILFIKFFRFCLRLIDFSLFKKKQPVPAFNLNSDVSEIEKEILENGIVFGLYDLKNDPSETKDVSKEHPRILNMMRNEIKKILSKSSGQIDMVEGSDKDEIAEKLDHLGYM